MSSSRSCGTWPHRRAEPTHIASCTTVWTRNTDRLPPLVELAVVDDVGIVEVERPQPVPVGVQHERDGPALRLDLLGIKHVQQAEVRSRARPTRHQTVPFPQRLRQSPIAAAPAAARTNRSETCPHRLSEDRSRTDCRPNPASRPHAGTRTRHRPKPVPPKSTPKRSAADGARPRRSNDTPRIRSDRSNFRSALPSSCVCMAHPHLRGDFVVTGNPVRPKVGSPPPA